MNHNQQGFTSFDDLPGIDPAVETLICQGQRRQSDSHLPKKKYSRKKKERDQAQKCLAKWINLSLPVDLKNNLEVSANKEDVPISQLVTFLLYSSVYQLESHIINLWGYKPASGCRKFEWNINLKHHSDEVLRNGENGKS
jgi:hypothetical protein